MSSEDDKNDSENESEEENEEEPSDIDNGSELSDDEKYQIELEKWFAELEKLHGVPFANEMRKKILLDKQIANELDYMAYSKQAHEDAQERLQVIRDQNDALFERTQKLVEQATNLNAKSYARFNKFLDDSEVRDKALESQLSQIMELKRKKLEKDLEK